MSTRNTPKTPYEIRLDLLQLAFDILAQKHQAAAATLSHDPACTLVKTSPSTEEVIAEAEKMNVFISKANQTH